MFSQFMPQPALPNQTAQKATPAEISAAQQKVAAALKASEIAVQFANAVGHALAEYMAVDASGAANDLDREEGFRVTVDFLGLEGVTDEEALYLATADMLRTHDVFSACWRGCVPGAVAVRCASRILVSRLWRARGCDVRTRGCQNIC